MIATAHLHGDDVEVTYVKGEVQPGGGELRELALELAALRRGHPLGRRAQIVALQGGDEAPDGGLRGVVTPAGTPATAGGEQTQRRQGRGHRRPTPAKTPRPLDRVREPHPGCGDGRSQHQPAW